MTEDQHFDAIILGAGAAGMMAALTAGQLGKRVLLLDHARRIGEKIRISGGGRCNFTNIRASHKQFLSQNPKFAISALKRFTPQDFITMVNAHGIAFHEKSLGQLFCDHSATDILAMLFDEMDKGGVELMSETQIANVAHADGMYRISSDNGAFSAPQLVVATGGLSIPKIGASNFGYRLAEQFGVNIVPTRPALVPLTFSGEIKEDMAELSGVSVPVRISAKKTAFEEALLFTHRGLSGPAILQISSYWREGDTLNITMQPDIDMADILKTAREEYGKKQLVTILADYLPKRLADYVILQCRTQYPKLESANMADLNNKALEAVARQVQNWAVTPVGSEGYRTAEVTLGGVDTAALDSKTMMVKSVPGLYFIGEVVDMTGWLGGYNFQWAWSSGNAAGEAIAAR